MTATVSIQLITVDGKKMTKSVFNQIQEENCFDTNFNFNADNFLGYVVDGAKYLIFIKNGELRKCSLNLIIELSKYEIEEDGYICDIMFFSGKLKNKIRQDWARRKFIDNEIELIEKNKKNANSFLQKLSNNQLYIAI